MKYAIVVDVGYKNVYIGTRSSAARDKIVSKIRVSGRYNGQRARIVRTIKCTRSTAITASWR